MSTSVPSGFSGPKMSPSSMASSWTSPGCTSTRAGGPPIIIGGESAPAMRRAAALGDGWIGLGATPEGARAHVEQLTALRREAGRERESFEVTLGGRVETSTTSVRMRTLVCIG
ncbi:MAG: LLM class flavin-dependent oxidoreductase [Dehalococcoidia bacterium]